MPTTYAIPDGRVAMAAKTYTGNGTTQSISNAVNGISFQPDFIWVKSRSNADFHNVFDSVRGGIARLVTNSTNAESSTGNGFAGITSTGFNLDGSGGGGDNNVSGRTYVGWQWKAGGTAVSNTAGSITSSVSANTTAGFSVVTLTAQASGTGTFGHGLGVAPSMVITKLRASANAWATWHISIPNTQYLELNTTNAAQTAASYWNSTSPTSTVVSLGSAWAGAGTMVAYCFAPVSGYSAFGSYTGNGSADGPFVYLGFRPKFILWKNASSTYSWYIVDTTRWTYNAMSGTLAANTSSAEDTAWGAGIFDILSNGFKVRTSSAETNASGGTFIYMAFAENPFKYANAR